MVPPDSPQFLITINTVKISEKPTTGNSNHKYLTANKYSKKTSKQTNTLSKDRQVVKTVRTKWFLYRILASLLQSQMTINNLICQVSVERDVNNTNLQMSPGPADKATFSKPKCPQMCPVDRNLNEVHNALQ